MEYYINRSGTVSLKIWAIFVPVNIVKMVPALNIYKMPRPN